MRQGSLDAFLGIKRAAKVDTEGSGKPGAQAAPDTVE